MAKSKKTPAKKSQNPEGPLYPNVKVQLTGRDGNAFFILANVRKAMERAGVPDAEIDKFDAEATSGDYDHLLQTCMKYVDVS